MKLYIANDILITKPYSQEELREVNRVFEEFSVRHSWYRGSGTIFAQKITLSEAHMRKVLNVLYAVLTVDLVLKYLPDDGQVCLHLEK